MHWAVLIQGDQGNGKSYFATAMRSILGPRNVRMVKNDDLHEKFTGWQRNTQLIVVEEMMVRQRLDLMNKLKPMITEPWCTIREMYRPPYEQPNRFNFLFFTNHNNALIVDNTDRRYCILRTAARPHVRGNAYYGPLFTWTRENPGVLLGYLLSRPLNRFQAKAHAPMTEGKRAMISQSMLPLDSFIYEKVEAGDYPFRTDLVFTSDLVKPLKDFNHIVTTKEIANAFGRLGYEIAGRPRREGEKKANLWAVRNADEYKTLDPRNLLALWSSQMVKMGMNDADAIYNNRPRNPIEESKAM